MFRYDHEVAIDVSAQVRYWRDGSADDLEAAEALLNAGKIRQAAFFVHLSIEKTLKARAVQSTGDLAPRSYDLLFLAHRAGITLAESQKDFLGRMQLYCLEGRYLTEVPPAPTARAVTDYLHQAAEVIRWLTSPLSSP